MPLNAPTLKQVARDQGWRVNELATITGFSATSMALALKQSIDPVIHRNGEGAGSRSAIPLATLLIIWRHMTPAGRRKARRDLGLSE